MVAFGALPLPFPLPLFPLPLFLFSSSPSPRNAVVDLPAVGFGFADLFLTPLCVIVPTSLPFLLAPLSNRTSRAKQTDEVVGATKKSEGHAAESTNDATEVRAPCNPLPATTAPPRTHTRTRHALFTRKCTSMVSYFEAHTTRCCLLLAKAHTWGSRSSIYRASCIARGCRP